MELLKGKNAVIFGVANDKSIAYAIARLFREQGANIGFTYAGEALKKRVEPISEELGGKFCIQCDVAKDEDIQNSVEIAKQTFGKVDIIVHSVAILLEKLKKVGVTRDSTSTKKNLVPSIMLVRALPA